MYLDFITVMRSDAVHRCRRRLCGRLRDTLLWLTLFIIIIIIINFVTISCVQAMEAMQPVSVQLRFGMAMQWVFNYTQSTSNGNHVSIKHALGLIVGINTKSVFIHSYRNGRFSQIIKLRTGNKLFCFKCRSQTQTLLTGLDNSVCGSVQLNLSTTTSEYKETGTPFIMNAFVHSFYYWWI